MPGGGRRHVRVVGRSRESQARCRGVGVEWEAEGSTCRAIDTRRPHYKGALFFAALGLTAWLVSRELSMVEGVGTDDVRGFVGTRKGWIRKSPHHAER